MTSAEDAMNEIERSEASINRRRDALNTKAETLQTVIYENANPSPWFIAMAIIGLLLGIWIIYVILLKPNMSGEWYDHNGQQWIIEHGLFNDLLCVRIAAGPKITCQLSGNTFKCVDKLGVWNYGNVVLFLRGGYLTRVVG